MLKKIRHRIRYRNRPAYPLHRTDLRTLPTDYSGLIVTSDIDKTYLQTEFESIRDLIRTALEKAEDKKSIPGMKPLLRGFRHGPNPNPMEVPLYFVSASPPQMRNVLEEKIALDGIRTDGLTFKNQLRLLRRGRLDQFRGHVLYKLTALLLNRTVRPLSAQIEEVLIGDDTETDADTYLLYAKILRGEMTLTQCKEKLVELNATSSEQEKILPLFQREDHSKVKRIYIHRTKGRPLDQFPAHDPTLFLAASDSLQIAIDAWTNHWIREEDVLEVAKEFHGDALLASIEEARQRGLFSSEALEHIQNLLKEQELLPTSSV